MIFVFFVLPLALYLLVLGWVNRQHRPVLVSGTWDFIGILFAGSGFLLLGGPAILSSLNERWRLFWLLGDRSPLPDGLDGIRQVWVFLALGYFAVVVLGCAWVFNRRRGVTCIYNVEPATVETALTEVCEKLGLDPIRSGNLFVFGLALDTPGSRSLRALGGLQRPHPETGPGRLLVERPVPSRVEELVGQNAILELEPFSALKHVTIRWDPPDSPLRPVLEAQIDARLGVLGSPYHETGTWLSLIGSLLLGLSCLSLLSLILRILLVR